MWLLLFSGCAGEALPGDSTLRAPAPKPQKIYVPLRVAYHTDPIVVPGEGSIRRRVFQRYIVRKRAGPWLRMLALGKELRRELAKRGLSSPLATVVRQYHGMLRRDSALQEFLPAPDPPWKSIKAELDAAWVLARLAALHSEDDDKNSLKNMTELLALFDKEMKARKPRLHGEDSPHLATCGESSVGVEEVYPDILALMSPQERDRLLLAALRER